MKHRLNTDTYFYFLRPAQAGKGWHEATGEEFEFEVVKSVFPLCPFVAK